MGVFSNKTGVIEQVAGANESRKGSAGNQSNAGGK